MKTPQRIRHFLLIIISIPCFTIPGFAQPRTIDATLHHLRNADPVEWTEFSTQPERQLILKFTAERNPTTQTLSLRQYDVKQNWDVLINDRDIGSLVADEKDLMAYLSIPVGALRDGENTLVIKCAAPAPDDIRVGEISLDRRSSYNVLTEAYLDITVVEAGINNLTPARITIITDKRSLGRVAGTPPEKVAVGAGYVYTGNGKASIRLPAGKYTIYAGRGFEYGIDSTQVVLKPGDRVHKTLSIKREVETGGWISCDTHVHTFTHSRHGDATEEDRALTIAGEGIELPVMTDHNINADLEPAAKATGVRSCFTPVTGNELTTAVGHFNVFKTKAGAGAINHQAEDWTRVSENINDTENNQVIILNHARDLHGGFRPFDPSRHLSGAGTGKDNWKFPANAMEVINSGSQQTDFMQLYRDWFGMLNRGYFLTPVGSSDSHDVSRYTVGQGRTYIQSSDTDPAKIDVNKAIKSFREGRVMVSAGLLTKITVNSTYGPGDIVPASREVHVTVEVSGPSWTSAERVSLYANGKKIHEHKIHPSKKNIIKWKGSWWVKVPEHDIFLVAIAEGPGHGMPWWPIAKPYQPSSPDWAPKVIGSTGVVWLDGDKNGKRNSAYDYAKEIVDASKGDAGRVIRNLSSSDEAIAMQAAALLWKNGKDLSSREVLKAVRGASPEARTGFEAIIKEVEAIR
jgi:hypothetical protein